ncbi:hypothetical protein BC628DRAFT_1409424 [Trametes gibbosa]|nr:hypothetical protein BC628DRAFT_1409424 [Trametes gibbosa]
MGVHGLTTFLREHKQSLATSTQLPPTAVLQDAHDDHPLSVVLDGWSFLYEVIYCADLPWVFGGEYPQLSYLIRRIVHAWVEVGIHLHFVFDGPYPTLKFPTLVSRISRNYVQNGLLFFRTSPTGRATPRFLRETAMLPPLSYGVCVETLVDLANGACNGSLHVHIADEEGDPYAVALAGRLGAYVAGLDSDFVVLHAEGYKGYIPLDEMVWTVAHADEDAGESVYSLDTESDLHDADGFKPARSAKPRKRREAVPQRTGRGIIPPDDAREPGAQLSISFTVYSPETLAAHLGIPVSLLPLLGALVGNDFTGSLDEAGPPATAAEIRSNRRANLQRLFFERPLTLGQRITRVANTLGGILADAFGKASAPRGKRTKKRVGSVMELIDAAVTALLLRPLDTFATGEKEAVVERIVEATLQYAIPRLTDESEDVDGAQPTGRHPMQWVSGVCPLHAEGACPLFTSLSRLVRPPREETASDAARSSSEDVRSRYITAYRAGHLNPHILDAVQSGTAWPWLFLEDPDKECVERSVGRPIREWMYAILDASVGLPSLPSPEEQEGEDEDELIDVVEEDDEDVDPLARLRGALKELDDSDDGQSSASQELPPSVLPNSMASTTSQQKVVTEYIRRGTRLAPEEVVVTPLAQLLYGIALENPTDAHTHLPIPPPLWPRGTRRRLLLSALDSDCPAVGALPDDRVLAVLALRTVVHRMHLRAQDNPGVKARQSERWTHNEARAFLACVSTPAPPVLSPQATLSTSADDQLAAQVPIVERHVQLVAQILAALEASERLAQVLLLSPALASPARRFSGAKFHSLLCGEGTQGLIGGSVDEEVWRACTEGLEDEYATVPQRKGKKEKKSKAAAEAATPPKKKKGGAAKSGMFALLADADA